MTIDKNELKQAIKKIMLEEPNFIKQILEEIIADNKRENANRTEKMKELIQKDFDRFEEVFKALA